MAELKGLLFDMDGTLVDNMKYHFIAFNEYAKKMGFTVLEPLTPKHGGMHTEDCFKILVGEEIVEKYGAKVLNDGKEATYRELYRPHIEPIAGLIELLQSAKKAGVKCAIGSAGSRENVAFIIEGLGIAEYIDASICGGDVTYAKPHPEIFTKAHEALGLKPEECIVVEDAVGGVRAGVAAGCKCIAVTTTTSVEDLTEAGATMCIDDYTSLTIEGLNEWNKV